MSANKHQPHVLVLPEDDANRQLSNGFLLHPALATRRVQVLEEVGGWRQVVSRFCSDHVEGMNRYPERFMVLLIDFDGQVGRCEQVKTEIPENLRGRVFVLGCLTTPEALRVRLGSYDPPVWHWQEIATREPTGLGMTTFFATMQANFNASTRAFARSCLERTEEPYSPFCN